MRLKKGGQAYAVVKTLQPFDHVLLCAMLFLGSFVKQLCTKPAIRSSYVFPMERQCSLGCLSTAGNAVSMTCRQVQYNLSTNKINEPLICTLYTAVDTDKVCDAVISILKCLTLAPSCISQLVLVPAE